MKHTKSSRGFTYMEPLEGDHCQAPWKLYVNESSIATGPYIWLRLETQADGYGEAFAHMRLDQAEELRDQLDYLIRNHYQVR